MNQPAPAPPTNIYQPIIMGILIACVFIGGFLLWALLVPIASAVIANGVVKVDSNRKSIQHLDGGIVSEILVKDGDQVSPGQMLVRLDRTRAAASLGVLEGGYYDTLAQHARLLAERDEKDELQFSPELLGRQQDLRIEEILAGQRGLFIARKNSLQGQLNILDQQMEHLKENITGLFAQKKSKRDQIESISAELKGLLKLLERGMIDRTRVLALQREKAELEGEYGEHTSQIAAARTSISEKQLEKLQLRKTFQEEVVTEVRRVQAELFDFDERLLAARHVLKQTEVRAPVSGAIVGMSVHTVGGVVAPGEVILELVPMNDNLIVETKISPKDIDYVRNGLQAGVRITAFNQRSTPELIGTLTYVSADIIENERTDDAYFLARVEVTEEELIRLGDGKVLLPGMTADVMIQTGERTPVDYLLEPLLANFRKALREH